jgi:hypothetical protein
MRELSDSKRVRLGHGDMIGEFEFRVLEGDSFSKDETESSGFCNARVIPIITSILPSVLRQVCLLHPLTRPHKSAGARKQHKTLAKASKTDRGQRQ